MKTFRFYKGTGAFNMLDDDTYIEINASNIDVALRRLYKHKDFEHGPYCITTVDPDDYDWPGTFQQCLSL